LQRAAGTDVCRGQPDREVQNGNTGGDWQIDPPMTVKRVSSPASATAAARPTATPTQVDTTACGKTSQYRLRCCAPIARRIAMSRVGRDTRYETSP